MAGMQTLIHYVVGTIDGFEYDLQDEKLPVITDDFNIKVLTNYEK